jgi:hypothetical protein
MRDGIGGKKDAGKKERNYEKGLMSFQIEYREFETQVKISLWFKN